MEIKSNPVPTILILMVDMKFRPQKNEANFLTNRVIALRVFIFVNS